MGKTKIIPIVLLFGVTLFAFNNCSRNHFQSELLEMNSDVFESSSMYVQSLSSNIPGQIAPIQNTNETQTVDDIECTAKDLNSWKECLSKAHGHHINRINITGPIFCTDSTCALSLSSVPQFKLVASGRGAFVRSGGFEVPLFKFVSVNFLVVSGVKVFDSLNQPVQLQSGQEESNSVCLGLSTKKCASTLEIYSAQSVQVSQAYFVNGKVFNAIFWGINDLKIDQSRFDNAFLFGIWGSDNNKISITNSIFQKNRSNAFLISFTKTEQAVVSQNIFDGNHHATAFHVCGASRQDPCPGGQVDLVNQVKNVTIEKNKFLNSRLSGEFPEDLMPNLTITGIEFEPHSSTIQNVRIDSNYYESNNAGMLYLNMPSSEVFGTYQSDVLVSNNKYCQTPEALYNFAQEYQWKSQVRYLNNQESCMSGMKAVPSAPLTPQNPSRDLIYGWHGADWGPCASNPSFSYSSWSECDGGTETRTVQCSGQSGQQMRQVRCLSSEGEYVSDSFCSVNLRPFAMQSCNQNCAGSPQLTRTCSIAPPKAVIPTPQNLNVSLGGSNCQLQAGQSTCATTVKWSAPGESGACVFANGTLFACQGESSSKSATWITEDGILFELKASDQASSQTFAAQKIYATSPYTLSGTNCQLNGKTTCTSLISWKAPGLSSACVFVSGTLFACEGENSSKAAPWIPAAGATFELRQNSSASSTLLKRLIIRGH